MRAHTVVWLHCEGTTSCRFPDVLLVIDVFGDDRDFLGHQVGRIETHSKLTDHGNVCSGLQSLHEGLRAGFGDGAQVVDEVCFGHADAGVDECECALLYVGNDFDFEVFS